jgi:hypothetical protein
MISSSHKSAAKIQIFLEWYPVFWGKYFSFADTMKKKRCLERFTAISSQSSNQSRVTTLYRRE